MEFRKKKLNVLYNVKHQASPLPTGVSKKNMRIHNNVLGFSFQYAEHISLIIIITIIIIIIIIIIVTVLSIVIIIIIIIIIIFVIKYLLIILIC